MSWAAPAPLDDGTAQVLRGGHRLLFDRNGRPAQLSAAVSERMEAAAWCSRLTVHPSLIDGMCHQPA